MLVFSKGDWVGSIIFCVVFGLIVIIPCIIIAIMGRKMINQMGQFPSQTPIIQMKVFLPLMVLEVVTFASLIGFYNVFSVK